MYMYLKLFKNKFLSNSQALIFTRNKQFNLNNTSFYNQVCFNYTQQQKTDYRTESKSKKTLNNKNTPYNKKPYNKDDKNKKDYNFNKSKSYTNTKSDTSTTTNNSYSAVKSANFYPKKIEQTNENSLVLTKTERTNVRRVIENPEDSIQLSETDIHNALMMTGKLPELDLKEIINAYKDNEITLRSQIERKILSKINMCLNKSLVEILRLAKVNPLQFKNFEKFWLVIQEEIITRMESLSNEQITEIISAYAKCELTPNIKIFEEIEEVILETPAKFLLSQNERIFYNFCAQKKGSTAFLKTISRRYFRHKGLIDSHKLVKFISLLNSHKNSIKGNFGLMKDMEDAIKNDIESGAIKFDNLITIASYLFTDNFGSNDIHRLVENCLIEKFENKIDVDISSVIKLIKSMSNYYIKNEIICGKIKNYAEQYLNGFIAKEVDASSENIENIEKKNKEKENNNSSTDIVVDVGQNVNVYFNEQYTKLITQINTLIWSFSKNKTFLKLRDQDEFKYFYERLKETFIRNIDYFNPREVVFSLEGIANLLPNLILSPSDCETITKKLKSFDYTSKASGVNNTHSTCTPHDTIKLLKILISNDNLLTDIDSFNNIVNSVSSNFTKFSYGDIVDFVDFIYNFPLTLKKILTEEFTNHFEKRLSSILLTTDIIYLCKLVNILSRPILHQKFSDTFKEEVFKVLKIRINEIPKEQFSEVLASSTKLKLTETVENLVEILEDLSNFEDIKIIFSKPEEYLNLLWTMLSINSREKNWNLKFNQKQSNLIEKIIQNYISDRKNNDEKINYFLTQFMGEKMNIKLFVNQNLQNREEIYYKYLQVVYLSYIYLKDNLSLDLIQGKELLEKINNQLFIVSTKFDLNARSNHISLDPASKCDKEVTEQMQNSIMKFFEPKLNTTIYPNFIDEFLNPVNILINFEHPNLQPDFEVIGIDTKIIAIVVLNKFYFSKENVMSIYDNRFRILREVFNFDVKEIKEEQWKELNTNSSSDKHKNFWVDLLGFDLSVHENIQINIAKKNTFTSKPTNKKTPKFSLTKNLMSN